MAATWRSLVDKWVERIIGDPGWRIRVTPDPSVEDPATATCEAERHSYREATITHRPDAPPSNRIACHEVLHIAVAGLGWPGVWAAKKLCSDAEAELVKEWITMSEEQVVDSLTRAFLAAYDEEGA